MRRSSDSYRRAFLRSVGRISRVMLLGGWAIPGWSRPVGASAEADVSFTEDLMREHGVLKRLLLVYEEAIRRLDRQEDLAPDAVADAALLIRSFIEDYHSGSP